MTSFISSERRERTAAFDQFVENTDRVLRTPVAQKALGRLANDLILVNSNTILPDMRQGEFHTPRKYQKKLHVSMIPVTDVEAPTAFDLTRTLVTKAVWSQEAKSVLRSETYGMQKNLAEFVDRSAKKVASEPQPTVRRGLTSKTNLAHTMFGWDITDNNTRIITTNPIEIVRMSLVDEDPEAQASVVGHEHVHALDMATDGILYAGNDYQLASEYRGYHVTHELGHSSSLASAAVAEIESIRKQYTDPRWPFTPTLESERERKAQELDI